MKLASSVSLLATAATGPSLLLPLFADAAGMAAVCESPTRPLELVSETNAPLRFRCGKEFPELVPLDGRAFAVDADGTCGATLVDEDLVQVALRPMPTSESAGVKDPKGYLVNFTKNAVEKDTKICFRCAPSPNATPKPTPGSTLDACVIFVTLKARETVTSAPVEAADSDDVPGASETPAGSTDAALTENSEANVARQDETNPMGGSASTPGVERRTPMQDNPEEATPAVEVKDTRPRVAGARICSANEERVTVPPNQQTSFGCGASMVLEPADRTTVFFAGADEKCSGAAVSLVTVVPGSQLTAETVAGQDVFTFKAGTLAANETKHLCYICSTVETTGNNTQCRILLTVSSGAPSLALSVGLGLTTVLGTSFALAF
ncbi:SRS domain-containing protein [Neospora caninum Liverpool]|uniref:SRS domain-containing protein n=1 Tax=Neospora caninum (strain Liverpool) TaxID=572307 RepID=F0VKW5_NEOCL|nr:SRS domain-containing protein [Neospora caninum Liverpool]CBZ54716.1 SRS domain-containing protein [Neospora caninum Liverpool]CEL69432.1 TPA: SRS domain-containing protein [Neospora caninum Liverpool]|eukprot:XP_003884746.1 SRS domain-containing protein [Neospora caninum Liverpool]